MAEQTTPRRQTEPPDAEGIWVRHRVWGSLFLPGGERETTAYHFRPGRLSGDLECGVPGAIHSPETLTRPGDVWDGPFPIPALPETERATDG